jgi:hypothetical protein
MGEAKNLMYSLVITLGLMGIFGFFIVNTLISNNTELPDQYNKTLTLLSNTTGIDAQIQTQKDRTFGSTNTTTSTYSLFDILGFWFQEGWSVIKLIPQSLNIFGSLMDSGMASLGDTEFSHSLMIVGYILRTLIVIGIIFLLLAILLKWEL